VAFDTASTAVVDPDRTPSGTTVATGCSVDITISGVLVLLFGRFRIQTQFGILGATILRDGTNLNSDNTAEPLWVVGRNGNADHIETVEFNWDDPVPAGTYTYDLVIWEASDDFTIQSDLTPCQLVVLEGPAP
jgi:hypothetical protein